MKLKLLTIATMVAFSSWVLAQQEPAPAKRAKSPRENPAFAPVVDDPNLPRVLLIGDSISIGYTVPVRELLKGKANVHRILTNGGPTTNGLGHLKEWLGEGKWDVIHFNWGLHDLKFMSDGKRQVDLEDYKDNLRELVEQLKATGAKLIWASTTPVPDGNVQPPRRPEDVVAYNAAALKIMKKNKIAVDDLFTYALPRLKEIQQPVNVHFTREGSEILAKQVAESIELVLGAKNGNPASKQNP